MNHAESECRRRNLESQDAWIRFSGHRQRVTQLIEASAAGGRLCVLGAGNCNDLDMPRLIGRFSSLELVDLDADAVHRGIVRQGLGSSSQIKVRGHCDLTGLTDRLAARDADPAPTAETLSTWLAQIPRVSDQRFDCVASVCTLSQLIETVAAQMSRNDPRFVEILLATRKQHLGLMLSLLESNGTGLLVTDFVSSETCPEIRELSSDRLPAAASKWIANHNFFTGTNPFAIRASLGADFDDAAKDRQAEVLKPWIWDMGPRIYAVSAVRFRRRA